MNFNFWNSKIATQDSNWSNNTAGTIHEMLHGKKQGRIVIMCRCDQLPNSNMCSDMNTNNQSTNDHLQGSVGFALFAVNVAPLWKNV